MGARESTSGARQVVRDHEIENECNAVSDFGDPYNVTPNPFSENEVERLLNGTEVERFLNGELSTTTHSGELADIDHLVRIARGAGSAGELAHEPAFLTAFATELRVTPTPTQPERKRRMIPSLSAKFVSIVAGVVLSAGAASAATGSLPDPVQQVVSDVVGHVGIDVPKPSDSKADAPAPSTTQAPPAVEVTNEATTTASGAEVTVGTTATTAPKSDDKGEAKGKGEAKDEAKDSTTTFKLNFGTGVETTETTKAPEKHETSGLPYHDPTGKTDHASLCQAWIQQHDFKTGQNYNETALHNVQQAAWAAGFTVEGWCGFDHTATATIPKPAATTTTPAPEKHDTPTTTKPTEHHDATTTTKAPEPATTTAAPTTTTTISSDTTTTPAP